MAHPVLYVLAEVIPLRFARSPAVVTLALASLLVAACSGDPGDGSVIDDPVVSKSPTAPPGDNFGKPAAEGPKAPGNTCAASSVEAKLLPLSLVFMIDRSGSMGDTPSKRTMKWDPVVAALKSFLGDAKAAGVSASLSYFPLGSPDDKAYCSAGTYQQPTVALTALPSAGVASSIDKIVPDGSGTPGAPALQGALTQAAAFAAAKKEAVAVVLVTDGDPNKCASTPAAVAQIAAQFKTKVPTYVIGIGSVATLNDIAKAGGTSAAQIVSTVSPTQTRDDLLKTIAKIRGAALPCELDIPAPPAGEALDFEKVNLSLTSAGTTVDLAKVKDCASGAGWHYDDPGKPTKLVLCPATCGAAKGEGKLSVTFGCTTKVL